jgi:hypothetical protein
MNSNNDNNEQNDFLQSISVFCQYFNGIEDINKLNGYNFSNGFLNRNSNNTIHRDNLFKNIETNLNQDEKVLDVNNFLIWFYFIIIKMKERYNISNLYQNKENVHIYDLLAKLININFIINEKVKTLSTQQIIDLKIIHSEMVCNFNSQNDYLNDIINRRVDQILSNRSNHVDFSQSNDNDIFYNDILKFNLNKFKKIIFNINKKIRYECHISILKSHLNKEIISTPSSLFYNRFPRPFFMDKIEFINKYNKMINDFQVNTMNLIIEELEIRLNDIKEMINIEKDKLTNDNIIILNNINMNHLLEYINKYEEKSLSTFLISAKSKCDKSKSKPYTINNNSINRDNLNNNRNNINSFNDTNGNLTQNINRSNESLNLNSIEQNTYNNNINSYNNSTYESINRSSNNLNINNYRDKTSTPRHYNNVRFQLNNQYNQPRSILRNNNNNNRNNHQHINYNRSYNSNNIYNRYNSNINNNNNNNLDNTNLNFQMSQRSRRRN